MGEIKDKWQMECPDCKRDDKIMFIGTVEAIWTVIGSALTYPEFGFDYTNSTYAWCGHDDCGYDGYLRDFNIKD